MKTRAYLHGIPVRVATPSYPPGRRLVIHKRGVRGRLSRARRPRSSSPHASMPHRATVTALSPRKVTDLVGGMLGLLLCVGPAVAAAGGCIPAGRDRAVDGGVGEGGRGVGISAILERRWGVGGGTCTGDAIKASSLRIHYLRLCCLQVVWSFGARGVRHYRCRGISCNTWCHGRKMCAGEGVHCCDAATDGVALAVTFLKQSIFHVR